MQLIETTPKVEYRAQPWKAVPDFRDGKLMLWWAVVMIGGSENGQPVAFGCQDFCEKYAKAITK